MSCTVCGNRWCWVCGLPTNHWSHATPFGCNLNITPSSWKKSLGLLLFFIFGFALIPIGLFLCGFFGCGYGGCVCGFGVCYLTSRIKNPFLMIFTFILAIPLGLCLLGLSLALGTAFGCLAVAILIIPAYVLHIFWFSRMIYWWCKSRVKTKKKEIKPAAISTNY